MKRRSFVKMAASLPAAAALTSFPAFAATKDKLTVALSADAYTMDPAKHSTFPTATVTFAIYDAMVRQDSDGKFQPALATSWSNPDPTTWRFKLREGVKFHNGELFDANAVKFTFDRALDPAFKAPYYSRISVIKQVTVVDQYTVDLKTANPYPTMLWSVAEASFPAMIVPPKYVQGDPTALATKPIGTGPYKLVSWKKDDSIVLEANPDYWGGAPKIKTLVFRPIPEVPTRIAELQSGGVDVISEVPPEEIKGLSGGATKVLAVPGDVLFFWGFDTLDQGPLQDKRVRQALNMAVDCDAIQKSLLGGLGTRIAVTLPANGLGYDPAWKPYPYDPAKAKQLLADAGYKDGFTLPLETRQGRYLKDKEICEALIGYLAKVGVKVEPQYMENGVWAQISEKKKRYGISYGGWSGFDPDLVWYPLLYTGQYQSYYSNKDLDALLLKGQSELDPAKRIDIYHQAGKILLDEAPHLPLLQAPNIYGVNSALNWKPRPDSIWDFRGVSFS